MNEWSTYKDEEDMFVFFPPSSTVMIGVRFFRAPLPLVVFLLFTLAAEEEAEEIADFAFDMAAFLTSSELSIVLVSFNNNKSCSFVVWRLSLLSCSM